MLVHLRYILPLACAAILGHVIGAQATEPAKTASATTIWGDNVKGKTYLIQDQVESDGLYRTYIFETSVGKFTVVGDALMTRRLYEYSVFEKMQDDSGLDHFFGSLGSSIAAPFRFGGQLLTSPIDTTKQSLQGAGNFFDALGASVENKNPERGSLIGGMLGTDQARRALAAQMKIDPFTDFAPLSNRLQELAAARSMGSLSVRGTMMAIPGGAALPSMTINATRTVVYTVSSVRTAEELQIALQSKTTGQIIRDAQEKLNKFGNAKLLESFTNNRNFTPTDIYAIALALEQIKAGNTNVVLKKCADAGDSTNAYLRRRQIEMYTELNDKFPIESFFESKGYLLAKLKDRRVLLAMPADHVLWTDRNKQEFSELGDALRDQMSKNPPKNQMDKMLVVTGEFSAMAKTELNKLKWETARLSLSPF
jgi:hypothetical protein